MVRTRNCYHSHFKSTSFLPLWTVLLNVLLAKQLNNKSGILFFDVLVTYICIYELLPHPSHLLIVVCYQLLDYEQDDLKYTWQPFVKSVIDSGDVICQSGVCFSRKLIKVRKWNLVEIGDSGNNWETRISPCQVNQCFFGFIRKYCSDYIMFRCHKKCLN